MAVMETPSTSTFSPIDNLPNELLDRIFCFLPLQGLLAARDVCPLWRTVIANNPELQDKLWLVPKQAKYFGVYTIPRRGDPSMSERFQLFQPVSGHPIWDSQVKSDFWRQTGTIGLCNEQFFTTNIAHPCRYLGPNPAPFVRRLNLDESVLRFRRDPRQNHDLYMGAYKKILVTQPPRTSISVTVRFIDPHPNTRKHVARLMAMAMDGNRRECRLEIKNDDGVRFGDFIREIEKAELQNGAKCDWKETTIIVEGIGCFYKAGLRNMINKYGISSVDHPHSLEGSDGV